MYKMTNPNNFKTVLVVEKISSDNNRQYNGVKWANTNNTNIN